MEETMSDWEPRSLTPTNGDWDDTHRLQFILRSDIEPWETLAAGLEPDDTGPPALTISAVLQDRWGGILAAPSFIRSKDLTLPSSALTFTGMSTAASGLEIQPGLVDFVRRFLPGGEFDPQSASAAFHLGEFLLELFTKLLTFPGGAMLAYSVLTSLGREVPELGATLNQESDLSIFEAIDSRLGKLVRKLLEGFDQVAIISPEWLQRFEVWVNSVNANYQNLEVLGVFEEPDFLSRLFGRASDQMDVSLFPGEKAGWAGVVFYVLGLIMQDIQPDIAQQLFESGDLFFDLSALLNLDLIGDIEVPLGPLDRFLAVVDGVEGLNDYGQAIYELLDPSLDPYLSGDGVWPQRISVMLSGIEGILTTGSAVVTLSGAQAVAAFATPLAAGIIICALISWVIVNWDWISVGLQAWRRSWNMLTQIILPYRTYQAWQWLDANLGRPVRENILQPIGRWTNNTLSGLSGLFQSLTGD
jgi:hypothetical protein